MLHIQTFTVSRPHYEPELCNNRGKQYSVHSVSYVTATCQPQFEMEVNVRSWNPLGCKVIETDFLKTVVLC